MKEVLVTGSNGQLGTALRKRSVKFTGFRCTFIDQDDLDLTEHNKVRGYFEANKFDYIINCAAYTSVDQAESQSEKAFSINAAFPELLAAECLKDARLIHISTDYVYDGSKNTPHLESDTPQPLSVYAHSKLAGEKALWNNSNCIIIRTSWLYSEYGSNFLKTMIRLSREKNELGVVFDQTGTPTYAGDLAAMLFKIIEYSEDVSFKAGIYNYSNEGVCSWFDFAKEIMFSIGSQCRVKAIRTHEYPAPAKRPAYGVMDKSKIKRIFDIKIPYWRESLQLAIQNLENQLI